ncbi:ATP-binding cassette domain-containing protein [Corynebacterium sp. zg254]|uniref:ABC transporter ATP-binding protein n=1 Tax=Corynebacterium zhongnanshanii TaxID=2768834 RepID=A0ABQ6VEH6_9CORY|nr:MULTISPECIES: ABC transporter ATP-binding protein [Corynebacterium]KAB3522842.1 ABC transporter ATP-binding protein [Corynebacterium zhongnanshanii]MCR5914088.1 ATP-binding cassette domain-containing protein [Corynebacterium sp. zg254]
MSKGGTTVPDRQQVTLRRLITKNARVIVLCAGLLSIYQVAEAMIAVLLGWLARSLIASENVWNLVGGIAVLGATLAIVSLSWQTGFRILQATSARNICRLRTEIGGHVISPGGHLLDEDDLPRQELPTVVGEDVVQAVDIIEVISVGMSALIGVVFCTVVLAMIDLPLGITVFLLSVGILTVLQGISRIIEGYAERQQALLAGVTARMTDILQGLPVISGVAGAHPAYSGYARKSEEAHADARALAWVSGAYEAVSVGSNVLLLSVVGLYAGYRTISGDVTLGELVTVVALSQFIAEPMRQCSRMPRYIGLARASVHRLQRISPTGEIREGEQIPPAEAGKVAISIDGEPAVRFYEGHLTAVHCSASWAAKLVDALVDGEAEGIRIRGRDVSLLSVDHLRTIVLAEPRWPALFGKTVGEVLQGGSRTRQDNSELNSNRSFELLRAVGLDELSLSESGVINYELTEGARNLSGGQRQRLALARALLVEPEVLVMVDPVSSVDSMTGLKVARAVREHRKGRTTIVLCVGRAFQSVADTVVDVKPRLEI